MSKMQRLRSFHTRFRSRHDPRTSSFTTKSPQVLYEEESQRRKDLEDELLRRDREDYLAKQAVVRATEDRAILAQQQLDIENQLAIQRQEEELRAAERLRQTTPEAIRRLRELMRMRSEMDHLIWGWRGVQRIDQELVMMEGAKADAILQEINGIIETWQERDWKPEEWKIAKRIKEGLASGEQRIWANNPPWDEKEYEY